MRAAARLTLFFIAVFVFFLCAGTSVAVIQEWLRVRYAAAGGAEFALTRAVVKAAGDHIPLAAYAAALLVPPATGRRGNAVALRGALLFALTGAAVFAAAYSTALFRSAEAVSESVPPFSVPGMAVDAPGISVVYLSPAEPRAAAVAARSGRPLERTTTAEARKLVPDASYAGPSADAGASASLSDDLAAAAARLRSARARGTLPLLAYSFSLAALLAVVGSFSLSITDWPLAGIALCAPAFRGILVLDRLADSGPFRRFIGSTAIPLPDEYLASAALAACALIVLAAAALLGAARGKDGVHG